MDIKKQKCWEYCDLLKHEMDNYVIGGYTEYQDRLRKRIHDELCELFSIEKGEFIDITNKLDLINYDGDKLYKLIEDIDSYVDTTFSLVAKEIIYSRFGYD